MIVLSGVDLDLLFADLLCSIETIEAAQRYVDSWPDRIRYEIPDSDPGDHWRFDSRGESISPDRNPEVVVQACPGIHPLITLPRFSRLHTDKA